MRHRIKGYAPSPPISSYIDDYVKVLFRLADTIKENSGVREIKNKAHQLIIPDEHMYPYSNRVIAVGAVCCAFILCDSRMTMVEISSISKRSYKLEYVSSASVSHGAHYINRLNKLDIIW